MGRAALNSGREADMSFATDRALLGLAKTGIWVARISALTLFLLPLLVIVLVSINPADISPSLTNGFTLHWFANVFSVSELMGGLRASLKIVVIVVPLSLLIGTCAGYAQWRFQPIPARVAETILSLPILVPLVVTGLALLNSFSKVGMNVGFWNIVIAHVILTFPFTLRFVLNSLTRYDHRLDEAAQSLGANAFQVFWRVTLPLLRPALFASTLFSFVVSFDDFGVTIFLTDAHTTTLPIAMYQYFEWNVDPTLAALSAMLVGVALLIAVVCEKTIGLERFVDV
jgi:putative spermidine/putrescine transport system permease protein